MINKVNDSNKKRNIHYGKKRRAKKNARVKSALNIIVIIQVVILISVVSVLVVRAYLSTVTQAKGNPFTPLEMTYTDTETVEPGGSSYGIVIESGETTGTLQHEGTDKSAYVHNSKGEDKKPVFVRVTMVMNIYDANGVNVTRKYPDCAPNYVHGSGGSNDWVADNSHPVRYYYKHVLLPDGETSNVFDSVNISNADQLPQNATVKIRVITDTVQAVETDERSWTAADYKYDQVAFAWTGATATVDKSGLSESQLASQVTAPVNWSFS